MNDVRTNPPPFSDRSGVTDAVRTQILATEHWSLLATRSMTWNEMFSRTSMFITLVSAAVVALALLGQATGFGNIFRLVALLVLPIVLLMGVATLIRLGDANLEDAVYVLGMNRLRHAYLELAPELEPYFTSGHTDDDAGIAQTLVWPTAQPGFARILSGTSMLVFAINVVVSGVIVALIAEALGAPETSLVLVGIAAGIIFAVFQIVMAVRGIRAARGHFHARFPG